jgi:uncharacterized membrane protein YkgB
MSFGNQSIRFEPNLGAGISPIAQSVRPIGPFLGSAGGAVNQHSMTGEGPKRQVAGGCHSALQEVKVCKGDPVVGETGMRRNDIMNQLNQLILYVSKTTQFRSHLDRHLIRAAMVFTFFAFSIQKWSQYTAEMLVPLISHSPVVFWLLPAFGVRGAGYFLGTTETIFGSLIFLGYWSPRLGILGALGSIATFIGTTSIIPFLPDGWAREAGGFPIMTLPLGFLMKDVLFLVASFYLLKQDLTRAAEIIRS